MKATWRQTNEQTGNEHELTWQCEPFTVTAVEYDTGEWVVRYGEDGALPSEEYSRGVFTRADAIVEAKACMRDLTVELVENDD